MIEHVEVVRVLQPLMQDGTPLRDWAQQRRTLARSLRHDAAQMRARTASIRSGLASRRPGIVAVEADREVEELRHRVTVAERRAEDLEVALLSNRRIGMAIGILMARHQLTEEQAFDLMRQHSNRSNVKLAAVAEEILYVGELGSRR